MPVAERTANVVTHLTRWQQRMRALQIAQARLEHLTGAGMNCALMGPSWELASAYTAEVAVRLRADRWLQWYWLDNQMGEAGKRVRIGGLVFAQVRTLRHLARIIVAHRENPTDPATATALTATDLAAPAGP